MSVACPECGGDVPVAARTIPVLAGSCPSCQREVLLMSPGAQPMAAAAPPAAPSEAALSMPHPGDGECDGTLELQVVGGDRLVGVCSECDEEFTFRLLQPVSEDEGEPRAPREERPRRRSFERRDDDGAPPSRPCRQCGGNLSFETAADGTLTGHCASCGNTFSLAPRRSGGRPGGGGGGFRGRGGGRDFGGGGGGGYRGRPPGRRFERRGGDDEGDDRRRRRFRRDD